LVCRLWHLAKGLQQARELALALWVWALL
jgi:hypothetical protein